MKTQYYKRYWDETTGDAFTDDWGKSTYYFETDDQQKVIRQIQVFENGQVLKYSGEYTDDMSGGLSEVPLDKEEYAEYQIQGEEFEDIWQATYYRGFPEIVCTQEVLWGEPRLFGRRLAVGDIVSLVDVYHDDIQVVLTDFDLTLQQVRQTLNYCSKLQCKKDNPERYCHNCLLSVEQFSEQVNQDDPEQPNWLRAERLIKQYFNQST